MTDSVFHCIVSIKAFANISPSKLVRRAGLRLVCGSEIESLKSPLERRHCLAKVNAYLNARLDVHRS